MTVRELVSDSAILIGALASGETLPAAEAVDAFRALNRMLDSWSLEKLILYARTSETFPFVASQQTYTMGTGGNFNTARPLAIEVAEVLDGTTNIPIEIIGLDKWTRIPDKTTTNTYPKQLYYELTNPLATLKFWPVPSTTKSVVLHSWKALTQFASLNTTVALPPGYEDALISNLAVRLAPMYGRTVSAELAAIASETKSNVKRSNSKPYLLFADPALVGPKGFNIYTGE
jgi:hypothetical protein